MLLIAAGCLWLFLAAVPAFADGGPHVAAVEQRRRRTDCRRLRRLPPGPHRAGRDAPQRRARNGALPDLPRRDRHRRDDGRRERRPVHAGDDGHSRRHRPRRPPRRRLRQGPHRLRRGRPGRIPERHRRPPERQGAGPDRRVPGRHVRPPAQHGRRGRGGARAVAWGNGPDSARPTSGPRST